MQGGWGVCVAGGVHGGSGCAWQLAYVAGGMHGRGACVTGGMHGRGHAWQGACIAGGMCGKRGWVCMAGEMATAVYGTHLTGMLAFL